LVRVRSRVQSSSRAFYFMDIIYAKLRVPAFIRNSRVQKLTA
jgi:hypothetical protein